ncbi:MAG: hypothetical protein QNJ54_07650 [Prochloraceae cyanobacterium]|nr:hypothetical protein [Prochloraceae cyanobacterium]
MNAPVNLEYGIDSFTSILEHPCLLFEAIAEAPELLSNTVERVARLLIVG